MADEPDKKDLTPDAQGAGTKHKPTKADLAKLPGGADFDVAGASSEDFDKHFEILSRQAKLDSLKQPATAAAPVPVTVVDALAAAPASPGPALVTKTDEHGQQHALPQATWDALGSKRLDKFNDVQPQPAKPADIA